MIQPPSSRAPSGHYQILGDGTSTPSCFERMKSAVCTSLPSCAQRIKNFICAPNQSAGRCIACCFGTSLAFIAAGVITIVASPTTDGGSCKESSCPAGGILLVIGIITGMIGCIGICSPGRNQEEDQSFPETRSWHQNWHMVQIR